MFVFPIALIISSFAANHQFRYVGGMSMISLSLSLSEGKIYIYLPPPPNLKLLGADTTSACFFAACLLSGLQGKLHCLDFSSGP